MGNELCARCGKPEREWPNDIDVYRMWIKDDYGYWHAPCWGTRDAKDATIAEQAERISSLEATVAKAFLTLGEVAEALKPLTCRSTPEHEADDAECEIDVTTGDLRKAKAVRERIMDLCHADPVPGCETSSAEGAPQSDDGEAR